MADPAYNYDTFHRRLLTEDLRFGGGPELGQPAPDFDLPTVDGGRLSLADKRGRPVLLEFASITCPMTRGARPGLKSLYQELGDRVSFISVYVREAHPGEIYAHHATEEHKLRHARDWVELDDVRWLVAVDRLDGATHRAYGLLPNAVFLVDRAGHLAFRALWAGQEGLLRDRIRALLRGEAEGKAPVVLGQDDHAVIPLLHGAVEFEEAVARGGRKAMEDFRREMGTVRYGLERLMSKIQPLVHREPSA